MDLNAPAKETIVAVATPPGRGGIGIVRLSGPAAALLLAPVLDLRRPLEHGRARVGAVRDPAEAGAILDQAVVTYFAAPRSYTGEDVLEVAVHGAPVLLSFLVRSALAAGARLAEPGEFTQRAFLSGRLDLTQAEAVHALVAASTLHQARVAAAQLGGAISRAVAPAKEALLQLIASLEAGIDFAEDDIDLTSDAEIARQIAEVTAPLAALERSFAYGGIVRDGVTLALVGRPNAGKSSLFNRLLERERAIVTAQPGTTRDPITERLAIGGIPVELVDTAGLRTEPEGEAEAEGIRRSQLALAEADFVLHVVDATVPADEPAWPLAAAGERLTVVNKVDLAPQAAVPEGAIAVSAKTGAGIEALRERLHAMITAAWETERHAPLVTNLRQQQAISAALASLVKAAAAAGQRLPHEFLLLDLYDALTALDTLTGATHSDEVLHRIFAGFCIGK